MNEVWKDIFKRYIDCYNAILILQENEILDEEEKAVHEHNLLHNIIVTMKSEVRGE